MTIYNAKTIHEKKTSKKSLEIRNQELKEKIMKNQKCALKLNLIEHCKLEKINQDI